MRPKPQRLQPPKELIEKLEKRLVQGAPLDALLDLYGVKERHFWRWLKRGVDAMNSEDRSALNREDRHCEEFVARLRKAVAKYRLGLVADLHSAPPQGWIKFMAILERVDPANFSRRAVRSGMDQSGIDPDDTFL